MNKQQRDLRSRQMNPNNALYYKSRMGNKKKSSPRPRGNLGFRCKLCGRAGKLYVSHESYFKYMNCGYCGGYWNI